MASRRNPHGYIGTEYKPRELRGAEQTLFDMQMRGYNEAYKKKFPNVTREQYSESVKRRIIAPRYLSEKAYNQSMLKMIEAGTDPRAASQQAATEAKTRTVKQQLEQQAQMKAIAKAGKSQFGATAVSAGMTGASGLAGASTAGGAASTGSSLIKPEITKSISKPKVSTTDAAMVQAATEAQKTAQKRIETEIKTQATLAPIRQRRQSMLKQQVKAMRRQTGRRALLSSPAGGAGFFTGYFK